MKRKILLFTFCLLCSFTERTLAQTDSCITHLKDASADYDEGNSDQAILLLKNVLRNCELVKADRIQANKLLILCYLSIDNLEEADKAAENIIKIDPNYAPDKFKDDQGLINIFKKYKAQPVFSIGVSGGINKPYVKTVKQYSVVFPDGQAPETYKTQTGFQLGIQAEHRVYRSLWAELGFIYRSSTYQNTLYNVDGTTVNYSEKLTYFDVPLSAKYYFSFNRLKPFVQAGIYLSLLSNAQSTTTRNDQKDIVDRTSMRNISDIGYFGGLGLGYTIKSFMLFANARYIYFPGDVNKTGTRYSDPVNLFKYYFIDNDFRLNNLQFNAGASLMLKYRNVKN
jgi:hypothetical protein